MSDRKRPGPAPQVNPIRASLYDSGWEDAMPPARAPEYSGTTHSLPRTEHKMDSITQEVDDLLEVDEEPSAPEPQQRPSPSVRARPVRRASAGSGPILWGTTSSRRRFRAARSAPGAPPTGPGRASSPGVMRRAWRPKGRAPTRSLVSAPTIPSLRFVRRPACRASTIRRTSFSRGRWPSRRSPRPHLRRHLHGSGTRSGARASARAAEIDAATQTDRDAGAASPALGRTDGRQRRRGGATLPPQGMTAPPASVRLAATGCAGRSAVAVSAPFGPPAGRDDPTIITPRPSHSAAQGFPPATAGVLALVTLGIGAAGGIFAAIALGDSSGLGGRGLGFAAGGKRRSEPAGRGGEAARRRAETRSRRKSAGEVDRQRLAAGARGGRRRSGAEQARAA